MYTVTQAARACHISYSTVRQWSREYEEFLSPEANPESGLARYYTDDDLAVFRTVKVLRDQYMPHNQIPARLADGERLEPVDSEPETAEGRTEETEAKEDSEAFTTALAVYDKQLASLQGQVNTLTERVIDAETRAASAETRAEILQSQVDELKAKQTESDTGRRRWRWPWRK